MSESARARETLTKPSRRLYPRPPVLESVIDVHVLLPEDVGIAQLSAIQGLESQRYPQRDEILAIEATIEYRGVKSNAQTAQQAIGMRLRDAQSQQIAQFRLNGFAFSRMAPYSSWEQSSGEAKRLWELYRATARPLRVTRVAVRYINRLDLPFGNIEQYLRVHPLIADEVSSEITGYVMEAQLPQRELGATLILRQGVVKPPRPDVFSILLDLDIFRFVDLSPDTDGLWSELERLHSRENEVFEACITDKARSLFA